MVHLLRGYCGKNPKLWDEHLPYVQHSYNRAVHSSTHRSPFETCFGYLRKDRFYMVFGREDGPSGCDDRDKAQRFIQHIQLIHQAVQGQLAKSQSRYKAQHDKHQVDHQFQVGEKVWFHISKDRMK